MAAAAAAAKMLRGGRSGSVHNLLPAIGRRVPQEGMLRHLAGSSPANLAAGRPIHTWRKMKAFVRITTKVPGDRPGHKSSLLAGLSDKYHHVKGHFEPSESEFVILHLHERLKVIEGCVKIAYRQLLYPLVTLMVGGTMVTPLVIDYIRLNKIETQLRNIRAEIARAKVQSQTVDIALHGV